MADLTDKELTDAAKCCAVVLEKEKGQDGPAKLIADTAQRLIDEVRRRRTATSNVRVKATTHFDSQDSHFDYPIVELTIDGVGFETRPLTSPAVAERVAREVAEVLGIEPEKP